MIVDAVAQAKKNLRHWNESDRSGESVHWARFNPKLETLADLRLFRRINASGEDVRLGLDDARLGHASRVALLLDSIITRWDPRDVIFLSESRIGDPPSTTLRLPTGELLSTDLNDLYLTNFALEFVAALKQSGLPDPSHILEIGAGYGGLILKLARLLPTTRFVFPDLPPANLLQAYYLNESFPGEVVVAPFGERLQDDLRYRFLIYFATDVQRFPKNFDGVINTCSFGEMNLPMVNQYFQIIQDRLQPGGLFMNANRFQKLETRFTRYPYDRRWRLIASRPSFGQEGKIWCLIVQRLSRDSRFFGFWKLQYWLYQAKRLVKVRFLRIMGHQ